MQSLAQGYLFAQVLAKPTMGGDVNLEELEQQLRELQQQNGAIVGGIRAALANTTNADVAAALQTILDTLGAFSPE